MDVSTFLTRLKSDKAYRGQIEHIEHLGAQAPRFAQPTAPLHRALTSALKAMGVTRLYTHQARAIDLARGGHHVVIATSTASGKTLCYNLPVLQAILENPGARALYLFPTKALAQDQLRSLDELTRAAGIQRSATAPLFGAYDGDTPRSARNRLRKSAGIILTNPDMLSMGILPNHNLWADFLGRLSFVVIDEAHAYRGIFGSQVACVLRRLRRVCECYSAQPQFIFCSATMANPLEHVERLAGVKAKVVNNDGGPRGRKDFVLWNPPFLDKAKTTRGSANHEAAMLFAALVRANLRTIAFTRARKIAELILVYARDGLSKTEPKLVDLIRTYRAGYFADERRAIERDLFNGRLRGVTATNALELGIDIGHLDATLLVGFPGTIASLWQQAGRAGRGTRESLSILVGLDDPLNQFFMRHPEALFRQSIEHALIDPDNRYILTKQLPAAAYEVALTNRDEELFGPGFVDAMIQLERSGILVFNNDRWYFTGHDYPAEKINIRSISGRSVTLVDEHDRNRVLEQIEASTALFRVHPGAIYLHQGDSYLVSRLDLATGVAYSTRVEVDYYTEPRQVDEVRILRTRQSHPVGAASTHLGDVRVTSRVVGFKRKQQFTEKVLATKDLDLPPESYETQAVWWDIPQNVLRTIEDAGYDVPGALHAVEHATIGLLPLYAMCDRWDIGGVSTPAHVDTGHPQIFIYDCFPGGIGIAEASFTLLDQLWRAAVDTIKKCPCEGGCPSCVQSPKCGTNNKPLDKDGGARLLELLIGRQ